MKNTAMHKCYYLVQPTNMQEKLNIELFCKFGKVKVTVPSPPPPAYYTRAFLVQGGGRAVLRTNSPTEYNLEIFSTLLYNPSVCAFAWVIIIVQGLIRLSKVDFVEVGVSPRRLFAHLVALPLLFVFVSGSMQRHQVDGQIHRH